ncbi:MAG: Crp/Fnr family transcriptional regulator [Acidobacteriota bacterium]
MTMNLIPHDQLPAAPLSCDEPALFPEFWDLRSSPASCEDLRFSNNRLASAISPPLFVRRGKREYRDCRTDALRQFEYVGVRYRLPTRSFAFLQGDVADSLHIVHRGKLKMTLVSHKGHRLLVSFAGPGDLPGLCAVLNHGEYNLTAETLEPSVMFSVARKDVLRLLRSSPAVCEVTARSLAREYREMFRGICRLGGSISVSGRLAQLVLDWAGNEGWRGKQDGFAFPLTGNELAGMVNSTRETVTRLMKNFEYHGIISRKGAHMMILRPEKLRSIAG